ncbi:MAG: DUF3634 family protein [Crocinitomicaceae bacterium]|nr:DUF3634 family protein [Crocinitomicaceae bacterium]
MFLSIKLLLLKLSKSPTFIIEVRKAQVNHVSGAKQPQFINDCKDIIRDNQLRKGLIYGTKNENGKIVIKTSKEISAPIAQRLRNVWSFYS